MKDSAEAKSPRGRSPSGKLTRMPCKDHQKGTCASPSCEQWHSPEWSFYKSAEGCTFGDKCVFAHHWFEEQPNKRSKVSGDESAVALLKDKEFWLYLRTWRRQDRHRFYGSAQPRRNQSDVSDFLQPYCAMPNFGTKTRRSIKFVMEILISAASTLQKFGDRSQKRDRVARALSWQRKS